jgi:transcriptional regulator with XRE-family HTH domain
MKTTFDELVLDPEFRKSFAIESSLADAAQVIADLLDRNNMKQADLARLLAKTPAHVSQLLSGKANMTVKTLAEIAYLLGASVVLQAGELASSQHDLGEQSKIHTFRLQEPNVAKCRKFDLDFTDIGRHPGKSTPISSSEDRSEYVA